MSDTYIDPADAKDHLGIDEGLTIHDRRIGQCIRGAEDWAENYTNRSLSELMLLDSPQDANLAPIEVPALPTGDPVACWPQGIAYPSYLTTPVSDWLPSNFRHYWAHVGPTPSPNRDDSKPLRGDAYMAMLLYMETLFDRNTDNLVLLQKRAESMLDPYRIGLGV